MRHERFGQSSERGTLLDQLELQLADLEEDAAQAEATAGLAAAAGERIAVRPFERRKPARRPLAEQLPRERIVYAGRIVIRQDGRIVAEHPRSFGRNETVYDPWHYVPVLARKPGALRNGAPFKDWVLPAAMERVWVTIIRST